MDAPLVVWAGRLVWCALPWTASPLVELWVGRSDGPAPSWPALAAWAFWGGVLIASAAARPLTLTLVRTLSPAVAASLVVMATRPGVSGLAASGVAVAVAAALCWWLPGVAHWFVNGVSYGTERRFCLRAPAVGVVLSPIVWSFGTVPTMTGLLLAARGRFLPGMVFLAAGIPLGAWAARVLHQLARRCVVLVPRGLTLVDPLALEQPIFFPSSAITATGPAPSAEAATDLTLGALGLALRIHSDPPAELLVTPRVGPHPEVVTTSVRFTPSQPAEFLAAVREKGIPIG